MTDEELHALICDKLQVLSEEIERETGIDFALLLTFAKRSADDEYTYNISHIGNMNQEIACQAFYSYIQKNDEALKKLNRGELRAH